jgi:hypothetical protein
MGDVMGPMMEGMGVSPEAFDAAGDAFGAAVGGGMHMAPADAGGAEMGAMMQDAATMMMPEGTEVPGPVMDAMGDMGQGFADAGCAPHDMAGEMMPPEGDPGFPFPCDASGANMVPPGDPAACPADACQPPPMDGACADMGGAMMPPDGGYDHAPMPADAVMPPPMDMAAVDPAAGAPAPGMDGMAPGADGMAPPDPTGELSGAENIAPGVGEDGGMAPPDPTGELSGAENIAPGVGEDGGMGALGDALGGPAGADPGQMIDAPADAADAAIGAAMDGAMDQGGAPANDPGQMIDAPVDDPGQMTDTDPEPDPSAGMG